MALSLMDKMDGDWVVDETSPTTDAQYNCRFDNGLQIEYGIKSVTRNTGANNVSLTWLRPFVSNSLPVMHAQYNTSIPKSWIAYTNGASNTGGTIGLYNDSGTSASGAAMRYFVVGRWK